MTDFVFPCIHCEGKIKASSSQSDTKASCPHCHITIAIPSPPAEEVEPEVLSEPPPSSPFEDARKRRIDDEVFLHVMPQNVVISDMRIPFKSIMRILLQWCGAGFLLYGAIAILVFIVNLIFD